MTGDPGKLFQGPCDFVAGVATLDAMPDATLPEIAFAGRSNVGKSSLINALTGRKALARTSNTPGRTQQLNFFDIAGRFLLVDMPGYGYAEVSKQQKQEWEDLIRNYLRGRPTLRCAFVLVDSRHGLKDSDRDLMKMLDESAVPYRIILTKADKAATDEKHAVLRDITQELKSYHAAFPEPFLTSSHDREGIAGLQEIIAILTDQ
jgi:GTP-binding protein